MVLLAKKDALFRSEQTRPLSLLDSFLNVQEKRFQNRSLQVLIVQTRVLLLIEQLWFDGGLSKVAKRPRAEIQGRRLKWTPIKRGGLQGSSFTPTWRYSR